LELFGWGTSARLISWGGDACTPPSPSSFPFDFGADGFFLSNPNRFCPMGVIPTPPLMVMVTAHHGQGPLSSTHQMCGEGFPLLSGPMSLLPPPQGGRPFVRCGQIFRLFFFTLLKPPFPLPFFFSGVISDALAMVPTNSRAFFPSSCSVCHSKLIFPGFPPRRCLLTSPVRLFCTSLPPFGLCRKNKARTDFELLSLAKDFRSGIFFAPRIWGL